jgi:hypothetical protein
VYLIGANFWPKNNGPWMYRDPWDPKSIAADLNELAELGANAVRIFCFLPDFLPSADVVSENARERLEATIELAAQAAMWSIPTFLVGHMSGENWAPQWSQGKDWYSDPALLEASELLIGSIVAHYAQDPRIAAWLLTNEWPLFAGPESTQRSTQWARRLLEVARAADPQCCISLGDGAWNIIEGQRRGPNVGELGRLIDFVGPHFYPKETDALRHAAFAGFAMKMLHPLGLPVLLEEFGCSSDQVDDDYGAAYYRTTLWSAMGAGNCGTLVWNSHDFTVETRPPYSHHPYELHFGIIRTDGTLKPQALEFRRFAAYVRDHDFDEWRLLPARAAIGRASYYTNDFPFDWGWTKLQLRDLLLQAYATSLLAGFDARFVDLASLRFGDVTTLFLPCLQQVTTEDAARVEQFARDGGTVYVSYGGEPWFPNFERFVGARLLIRYGLVEALPAAAHQRTMQFIADFGDIPTGTELSFEVRGLPRRSARSRCEPAAAAIVAAEPGGEPVLLDHKLGRGRVIFLTYPLEYYHLEGPDANRQSDLRKIYRAVARLGKAAPDPWIDDAHIQTFAWQARSSAQKQRVLLINHSWEARRVRLLHRTTGMKDVLSAEPVDGELAFEPKGVRLIEVTVAG